MMIVKNYVAPSKIHGVGLFAGENVEKDQIIYVLTPGIDLVMTPDAIEKFGEEFSRFMGVYAYRDIKSGEITISLDNALIHEPSQSPEYPVDIYFRMGGTRYRKARN
jgi:uncharacterized protein